MVEKIVLSEGGFVYRINDSISIVCAKTTTKNGLRYEYRVERGSSPVGQIFQSPYLPGHADAKRDMTLVRILMEKLAFTREEADKALSDFVEEFNAQPQDVLDSLRTMPDQNQEEKAKHPTIEEKYGTTTYALALKILSDPFSFQIVRHVLDFEIAGEYKKKMLVFSLTLTVLLGRPTWIIIAGKQAEGKSRLLEGIFDLLPECMKERMNSGKLAAIYRKSLDNPYYYDRKVINFGDLGDMETDLSKSVNSELKEVFSIFKQLSTDGEVSRTINIKDDATGEWVSVDIKLKGNPLIMFTTTAAEFEPQTESRAFIIYPTMSRFQNDIVALFQKAENLLPRSQRYPSEISELKKAITCALEILWHDKIEVLNPYTTCLDAGISSDSPNIKRDRPKIYSLVNTIALWYSKQRERDGGYVIADILDNLYALNIAGEAINRMLSGGGDENFVKQFEKLKDKMQPLSRPLADLKADTKSREKDERVQAETELEEKAITNDMVQDWLGIGVSSAAALTRQAAKKGLLVADKSTRPYKYYLPAEALRIIVKTNGTVAFDCNATIKALFDREELCKALDGMCCEKLKKYISAHTYTLESSGEIKTPEYRLPEGYKIGDVCILTSIWDRQLLEQSRVSATFSYLSEQLGVALQPNATDKVSDSEKLEGEIEQPLGIDPKNPLEVKRKQFEGADYPFKAACDYCGEKRRLNWRDSEGNYLCDECKTDMEAT